MKRQTEDRIDGLAAVLESRGAATESEARTLRDAASELRQLRERAQRMAGEYETMGMGIAAMAERIRNLNDRLARYEPTDADLPVGPNAKGTA